MRQAVWEYVLRLFLPQGLEAATSAGATRALTRIEAAARALGIHALGIAR